MVKNLIKIAEPSHEEYMENAVKNKTSGEFRASTNNRVSLDTYRVYLNTTQR